MSSKERQSNFELSNTNNQVERIYSFDLIRIIAIFSVVMIHVSARWVAGEDIVIGSFAFNIGNFFDSISRIGVPLFCMLSGALLLNENKDFAFEKMRKSIINIGMLLFLWNVFYAFVYNVVKLVINGDPSLFRNIIIGIINGHYHLWYLYMLIGFYLIIPFIKPFIKKSNWKNVLYFVMIAFFVKIFIPLFDYIFCFLSDKKLATLFIEKFNLDFFKGYTIYFLTGWLITNIPLEAKKRYVIYGLGVIGVLSTIFFTRYTSIKENLFIGDFYSNFALNVFLNSLGVFIFIYYAFSNLNSLNNFVLNLSKLSFGVYLIHPFVQSIFNKLFVFENPLVAISLEWVFVICVSYSTVYLMTKIPLIKKLVRG